MPPKACFRESPNEGLPLFWVPSYFAGSRSHRVHWAGSSEAQKILGVGLRKDWAFLFPFLIGVE